MVEGVGMNQPLRQTYPDRDLASVAAAGLLGEALRAGLAARGAASLMLSGGSTPGPAYEWLGRCGLDWAKITVGLVDERWVAPEDERSNARLVRETLLGGPAAAARFLPMCNGAERPFEATADVAATYRAALRPCDAMMLGMGPDGHTASWFPGATGLETALDETGPLVAGIDASNAPVAGNTPLRMTLTAAALTDVRCAVLLIFGSEKLSLLDDTAANLPIHHACRLLGQRLIILRAP